MHVSFLPKTFRIPGLLNNIHCLEFYQTEFPEHCVKMFLSPIDMQLKDPKLPYGKFLFPCPLSTTSPNCA